MTDYERNIEWIDSMPLLKKMHDDWEMHEKQSASAGGYGALYAYMQARELRDRRQELREYMIRVINEIEDVCSRNCFEREAAIRELMHGRFDVYLYKSGFELENVSEEEARKSIEEYMKKREEKKGRKGDR